MTATAVNSDMCEVLETIWNACQEPDSAPRMRQLSCAPHWVVADCINAGYVRKTGMWGMPELTGAGREKLKAWRTCYDCHEEIVEQPHYCTAKCRRILPRGCSLVPSLLVILHPENGASCQVRTT